jgi:hypothetical protein
VNEALAEANREGRLEAVLEDARRQFAPRQSPLGNRGQTESPASEGLRRFSGQAGTAWAIDLTAPLGDRGGFGQVYAGHGSDGAAVAIKIVPLRQATKLSVAAAHGKSRSEPDLVKSIRCIYWCPSTLLSTVTTY